MNRRPPPSPQIKDIFGTWVPLVALMASKTKPLPLTRHDPMIERLERAYGDMATARTPSVQSWRDLTDMHNFLQSLVEMGWAEDEGEHINDTKGALLQAAQAFEGNGKLRLTGPNLAQLRTCIDQFTDLTKELSEHSYWQTVSHVKRRIEKLRRGAKRKGDIVVSL